MLPSNAQLGGLSSDFIFHYQALAASAKDMNAHPSAFFGQELIFLSGILAQVPIEPVAGFLSLAAAIGGALFLSEQAPKPPALTQANVETAVLQALAKFQIETLETQKIPIMIHNVKMKYTHILQTFAPNTQLAGMCCLTDSTTCLTQADECTTGNSCTYDNSGLVVNTEACCDEYGTKCKWNPTIGPNSPVSEGQASELFTLLEKGMQETCGASSGSAVEVLDTLAEASFGAGSAFDKVKKSLMFQSDCEYTCPQVGMWKNSECAKGQNAFIQNWPEIKEAAHTWLLGYYTLLQYGAVVFKTISVNSKNTAFLAQYSNGEPSQSSRVFSLYQDNFLDNCDMAGKTLFAKALQTLLEGETHASAPCHQYMIKTETPTGHLLACPSTVNVRHDECSWVDTISAIPAFSITCDNVCGSYGTNNGYDSGTATYKRAGWRRRGGLGTEHNARYLMLVVVRMVSIQSIASDATIVSLLHDCQDTFTNVKTL